MSNMMYTYVPISCSVEWDAYTIQQTRERTEWKRDIVIWIERERREIETERERRETRERTFNLGSLSSRGWRYTFNFKSQSSLYLIVFRCEQVGENPSSLYQRRRRELLHMRGSRAHCKGLKYGASLTSSEGESRGGGRGGGGGNCTKPSGRSVWFEPNSSQDQWLSLGKARFFHEPLCSSHQSRYKWHHSFKRR